MINSNIEKKKYTLAVARAEKIFQIKVFSIMGDFNKWEMTPDRYVELHEKELQLLKK